jgi:hypothetical protein
MLALLAATAANFAAPLPQNAEAWFGNFGAHPKEGPLTLIASEIVVDPKGRPETCSAKTMLGMPDWAPFTCELILVRGQFKAARIGSEKTYGVFRLRTAWRQSGYPPNNLPVWDFELSLNKAPSGVSLPLIKKIQFVVEPTGEISACSAESRWNSELVSLVCKALPELNLVRPVRNKAGETVRSVQDATVHVLGPETK